MNLANLGTRAVRVADVMTVTPLTLLEETGVAEAIECMSQMGARRALVVNDVGSLRGIVSIDDLLRTHPDSTEILR
jgi:CBS domain-containing protein